MRTYRAAGQPKMSESQTKAGNQNTLSISHSLTLDMLNNFLAALQPYKSACPRWWREHQCKNIFQLFSLVMKTKLVQNVNRMSERQNDMPKDRLTERQIKTKRLFSLVIKTKVVQNVNSMSER